MLGSGGKEEIVGIVPMRGDAVRLKYERMVKML